MTNLIYLNIGAVGSNGAPPASTKTVKLDVGNCSAYKFRTVIRDGTCYLFCCVRKKFAYVNERERDRERNG